MEDNSFVEWRTTQNNLYLSLIHSVNPPSFFSHAATFFSKSGRR